MRLPIYLPPVLTGTYLGSWTAWVRYVAQAVTWGCLGGGGHDCPCQKKNPGVQAPRPCYPR